MQRISVEAFASMVMKNNKGYQKKELVKTLNATLTAKKNGEMCIRDRTLAMVKVLPEPVTPSKVWN